MMPIQVRGVMPVLILGLLLTLVILLGLCCLILLTRHVRRNAPGNNMMKDIEKRQE
jgi:hypothetical protein